jgi:SAM-dependent methyltransferase
VHPSAYAFASTALSAEDVKGKRVVEVGAYDYNGSVRGPVTALGPESYLATDAQDGPGVDMPVAAERLPVVLGRDCADAVVSTEMLEHAEAWRPAVTGMVRILAPGGVLLLTARGPGFPYHPHPGDFQRFTVDHMDAIAEACGLEVIRLEPDPDPNSPGVFLLARKPQGWDGEWMEAGLAVIEPGPPR